MSPTTELVRATYFVDDGPDGIGWSSGCRDELNVRRSVPKRHRAVHSTEKHLNVS